MGSFWIKFLEQALILAVMSYGVYITYRILDFPDLTVDGSFPLGAAVASALLLQGVNPILATALAAVAGALGGLLTGVLHVKVGVTNLLSGILIMTGLYSVNLRVMGQANIALFGQETLFTHGQSLLVIVLVALSAKFMLDISFKTQVGTLVRATGDNHHMVTALGVDIGRTKTLGLMISNSLVALSGALMAQYQGFADIGMGSGMIITGLAAIIMGRAVFSRISWLAPTTVVLGGTVLYRASLALALRMGLAGSDLKLVTALIVISALGLSGLKLGARFKIRNGGGKLAGNPKPGQDILPEYN